jgi:hypothetical protein
MAAQQFFLPFRPAINPNGLTVSGAKLYFYLTETSTPTSVYSDVGLTTPLTNPVTANSAGVWPIIYLNDAVTYRVVLTDGDDVELDQADPYLPNTIDGLADDLQDIADAAAASKVDAETAQTAAEAAQAAAEAAVGAVVQEVGMILQPDDGVTEGRWYVDYFRAVATGTCDVNILIDNLPVHGPFEATSTASAHVTTGTVPAGSAISFEVENVTGTPTTLIAQWKGLPA